MKRTVNLGLAILTMALLTAAVGVSSASASWFVSQSTSASGTPFGNHLFNGSSVDATCAGSSFTASTIVGGSASSLETNALKETAGKCTYFGHEAMQFNNCRMLLKPGAETSPGVFAGTIEVGPAGCGPWTFQYSPTCQMAYLPKSPIPAEFQNSGTGNGAAVTVTVAEVPTDSTYGCNGQKKSNEPATFSGSWDLTAPTGIKVATKTQHGLSIVGGSGDIPPSQPKFAAESGYPTEVRGSLTKPLEVKVPGLSGSAQCGGSTTSAMTQNTESLNLGFAFTDCIVFGFAKSTATFGASCTPSLKVANAGPPYTGSLVLSCSNPSEGLTLSRYALGYFVCSVTLPAQTLGSVSYQVEGSGYTRHVVATVSGSNLQHTQGCGVQAASDATLSMTLDLTAFR